MGAPGLLGWLFSPKKEEIEAAAASGRRVFHSKWGTTFIFSSGAHIFFAWKAFALGLLAVVTVIFFIVPRP